jgi:RNA polymerase sigma-70 factor (ECF subfamily)
MLVDELMAESRNEIASALSGDRQAFRRLVAKHQRLVSHVVFRFVRDPDDREDLCQEVFISVYQNLASFRGDCKLSTWIGRIAHNKCLNWLEKKRLPRYDDLGDDVTIDEAADESAEPDQRSEQRDLARHVRAAIDRLPALYGTILALYHLEEMSYREIGEIMNLPEGTTKSYLFRARRMLKESLAAAYRPEELWQ